MTANAGLETALERAEHRGAAATAATNVVVRQLKKAQHAAVQGQVRDLRRALESAAEAVREAQTAVEQAREGYDFDEADWLASGGYAKELLAAGAEAGIAIFEEDDRLLCYPSIVRVLANEVALEIDRKRVRGLRPSAVLAALGRAQQAGTKFRPEPFLNSVLAAYDFVVAKQGKAPGAVVRLVDIYDVLTLLPGQARDYSRPEFARDLYSLDQLGVTEAKNRRLRWSASSGTRNAGVLSTVSASGQQQRYWGIAFEEPGT